MANQITATQKFVRMSPRKLRLVAAMVKKLQPSGVVDVLPYVDKRAALPLQKTIKTAIANAKQQGIDANDLRFVSIEIGQGPRLKRWRAGSRGRIKPYTHDMAHIRVVLTSVKTTKSEIRSTKSETKKETHNMKKTKKTRKEKTKS